MNLHYRKMAESVIKNALDRAKSAKQFKHMGLRGRAREIFASSLLTPFLQQNVGCCTGIIVDSMGGESKQADIIVYDKNLIPPINLSVVEGIVPVESVLAVIEVKSEITKAEIKSAIENAHSIKALCPVFREVTPSGATPLFTEYKSSILCCLYAFETDQDIKKECARMEEAIIEINDKSDKEVKLPLSAICVGDELAIFGYNMSYASPPDVKFKEIVNNPALHFISFLVDQLAIMQCQRQRMLMSHYLIE